MQIKQTKTLQSVFMRGRDEAVNLGTAHVGADHLFLAILKEGTGHAHRVLKKLLKDWELYQIRVRIERDLKNAASEAQESDIQPDVAANQLYISLNDGQDAVLNTGHLLRVFSGTKGFYRPVSWSNTMSPDRLQASISTNSLPMKIFLKI